MSIGVQTSNQQKAMDNAEVQTRFQLISTSNSCGHQNYVPFLGKQNRFHTNKHNIQNPPIGAYNLPSCFNRTKSYIQERVNKFLLESEKKKEQMSMFKSSINRFSKVKKDNPGPTSYNLFRQHNENKGSKVRLSLNTTSKEKKIVDLARTCPSIPDKQNRYGYSVNNGKIKTIEKNGETIQKEKQSRKQYLSTLNQQKITRYSHFGNQNRIDYKKKLYGQTQKVVANHVRSEKNLSKTLVGFRKPKYEHLYNSKGVQPSNYHQKLGPGKYDVKSQAFNLENRRQKYQFFGSTQVRFRERTENVEKGYSLIQIVKEREKKTAFKDMRQSPPRKTSEEKENKTPYIASPGPGQYYPKDETFKKSRGNPCFPQSERFQGTYAKNEKNQPDLDQQCLDQSKIERKNIKIGKLKKQRFRPLQKVYNPVCSNQICGILSEKRDTGQKDSKKMPIQSQKIEENEIKCWSRQDRRQVEGHSNEYMKQLKEELALINETPRTGVKMSLSQPIKAKQLNKNKNQTQG